MWHTDRCEGVAARKQRKWGHSVGGWVRVSKLDFKDEAGRDMGRGGMGKEDGKMPQVKHSEGG